MQILNRLVAIVALLVMVVPAAVLLLFPDSYGMPFIQLILLCGVIGIVTARQQLWHKPGRWFVLPIVAAVVAIPFAVILRVFGSFDVLSLVFHAQFGVEGTTLAGFEDEILEGAAAVLGITFAGYALANLINRRTAGYVLTALVLVLLNPIVRYGYTFASATQVESDLHLALEKLPDDVAQGARPDMVMIYLEGIERAYADRDLYGDVFAPLEAYENQGISFTAVRQVPGTGWSLAGLVSTQCGLPLVPNGLRNGYGFQMQVDFLSDHTCLSDLTAAQGYQNTFLFGGLHAFGGMDHFFRTHKIDQVIGYDALRQSYPEVAASASTGQMLDDQLVFDAATSTYDQLKQQQTPFLLMVETYGPHGSTSVLSRNCTASGRAEVSPNVTAAIQCTLDNMVPFLDHIAANRDGRPTVVILSSDHLNHDPAIRARIPTQDRSNTVIMYALRQDRADMPRDIKIAREATMMDIFPTILSFSGLAGRDAKAGLGRSLLGDAPTLLETKGFAQFTAELFPNPALSQAVWGNRAP